MSKLKYYLKRIVWGCLHFFWCFPIDKKKIVFMSFSGAQISCNPYYIYDELRKRDSQLKLYWAVKKNIQIVTQNYKTIKINSFKYFFHILTSKVIVSNTGVISYIPYRNKQCLIDTWHGGGAYKKVGIDVADRSMFREDKLLIYTNKKVNYLISSCKKFSEFFTHSMFYTEKQLLEIGLPRNDIFFDKEKVSSVNKLVRKLYNIPLDCLIILYAPTSIRLSSKGYEGKFDGTLDINLVIREVEKKFNKKSCFLLRLHEGMQGAIPSNVIDVTSYSNMQELICASDILITDYSSCMWDFALTYKPGFLFTPNIEKYEKENGIYTPISTWPYPYAKTNEEFSKLVEDYDEKLSYEKIKNHFEFLQSFENGTATEKVCEIIKKCVNK